MNITTNASAETLALETQLEKLQDRSEAIADDIAEARENVADVQRRFIADTASHADLIAAEQSAAALENAASVLNTQIAAQETALERQHKSDERQRKAREALLLASQVETERRAAFERAAVTLEAIATDLPAAVSHIKNAALTSRRLRNLLAGDNPPKFTPDEMRRLNDLSSEDVISVKAQIYMQASENAALIQFRELLERAVNGFSVAPPAPSAAPADLSDLNAYARANVELNMMLDERRKAA